jgi:hypothetical protein
MVSTANPVRRISVFSTGSVRIHPEHIVASGKPLYWWILTSKEWLAPRPINVYLLEHKDGVFVFDAGQDRASVTQSDYFRRFRRDHLRPARQVRDPSRGSAPASSATGIST